MKLRSEHPKPQMRRNYWKNLNGEWLFAIGGDEKDLINGIGYDQKIKVPFCPESALSGVNCADFMHSIWYSKTVFFSDSPIFHRVILHFGAVDYEAYVYVNGILAGFHVGGYTSFEIDISRCVCQGDNVITVNARDDTADRSIPSGKQSPKTTSYGCRYTRTTGIWQTVWLEYVPKNYVTRISFDTDIHNGDYAIRGELNTCGKHDLECRITFKGKTVSRVRVHADGDSFVIKGNIADPVLWDIGKGNIYHVKLILFDNSERNDNDVIYSYFAYRKIELIGKKLFLNGKPLFLRHVLDQGYYPDGVYTAPDGSVMRRDIDLALQYGFNGARLHQKIFEDLYLYYADFKGFTVWVEYPNWGCKMTKNNTLGVAHALSEWCEAVESARNHPCVIGWCPLNEAWFIGGNATDYATQKKFYESTKYLDKTRPVIGSSGGDTFITDIHDVHFYTHNAKTLKRLIASGRSNAIPTFLYKMKYITGKKPLNKRELKKLPLYVSEYGGLSYLTEGKSWGYFAAIESETDFISKYTDLTNAIFDTHCIGFCYTQLYDVEQEQNGLLKYDRTHKLSDSGIKAIKDCNSQEYKK